MQTDKTIAAISTPTGTGGIAVIRISGEDSFEVAAKIFKPKNPEKTIKNAKGYTALYGDFNDDGKELDDGVILFYKRPHSYTGEDVVELFCHGGVAVTQELLKACYKAGAAPAPAGEFTKRAMLNGKMSLTQAEAVMDLISAHSSQGAAAAHAALKGNLSKLLNEQKEKLINIAGHIAAEIDFPEEGVEKLEEKTFFNGIKNVKKEMQNLINNYEKGVLLKRGVRTVIAGSPNVGKSTIFNLLSGFERAIVTPVAGTTRDVVSEELIVGGVALNISDTAGLRKTNDSVEIEGIKRSYAEIRQAGLIIAVFDASEELKEESLELAMQCSGRQAIAVINKSDLGIKISMQEIEKYFKKAMIVSAKNADETKKIIEKAVVDVLEVAELNPDAALLANERQLFAAVQAKEALEQAEKALENGFTVDAAAVCLDDALYALAELSGENVSEAVVEDIFSRFCVGK